jgi:transposase
LWSSRHAKNYLIWSAEMTTESIKNKFAPGEFVAWVGLDWADKEHKVSMYDVASGQVEASVLRQSGEAFQQWLAGLRKRYGGGKVAVVLEQWRGGVLYGLMNCDFIVLYPVNPESLANYRKALYPSGAKDDPVDSSLLREMVQKNPERFRQWIPDDPDTRALRLLVEGRRKLVNQMTRLTNRLTSELKGYYPQALEWAGELNSAQACAFLERWPTVEAVQKARPSQLRKLYLKYGRPRPETIDRRVEQIKEATPLTQDPAAILAGSVMVQAIVKQIRPLNAAIDDYDGEIGRLFQKHPDRLVFESFPGAGPVLAPRLLAAFGADRERWRSAAEIQKISGIAPVTKKSGTQHLVHWRLACPKFLRQTFHEFAGSSIQWCSWAKGYYQHLRDRGKAHHAAVRSLAFKLIRIIFACWKTRTLYDNGIFLEALAKRDSPLSARAAAVAAAGQAKAQMA